MKIKPCSFYTMLNREGEPTPVLMEGFIEQIGTLWVGYYYNNGEWVSVELTTDLATVFGYSSRNPYRNFRCDLSRWNNENEKLIESIVEKPYNQKYRDLILKAYEENSLDPPFKTT